MAELHFFTGTMDSGKSTLAYSIAGHPRYTITAGSVTLDGEDVLAMRQVGDGRRGQRQDTGADAPHRLFD